MIGTIGYLAQNYGKETLASCVHGPASEPHHLAGDGSESFDHLQKSQDINSRSQIFFEGACHE